MSVKKLLFSLSSLLLAGCSLNSLSQIPAPRPELQVMRQNASQTATTARTGFPIALAELEKVDPQAQLYEIDVWQEAGGKNLQYGFLRSDQSGNTFRVLIDVASQRVSIEEPFKGTAALVNRPYWQQDSAQIYARAQENGLQDQYYLATLWEDTWHISGLKQDLYFQMDSQTGEIKLRCTGPYNDHCTLGDGTPVQTRQDLGMQRHIAKRKARQSQS